jgi:hypothetical protein
VCSQVVLLLGTGLSFQVRSMHALVKTDSKHTGFGYLQADLVACVSKEKLLLLRRCQWCRFCLASLGLCRPNNFLHSGAMSSWAPQLPQRC